MKTSGRNKVLKVLLLMAGMSPFLSCNSCSDQGGGVTTPVPPKTVGAYAEWSPDGRRVAVCWGGWSTIRPRGIYLIDTAGWVTTELFIDEAANFSSVAWSPTGEWLLFAYNAQIYKIKPNGDSLTQLTFTSRQWECDWSQSDTLVVYAISIGDSAGTWTMSPSGVGKQYLISQGFDPSFASGDSILFLANSRTSSDSAHISLMNPVDSSVRTVLAWKKGSPHLTYEGARVSPDGNHIVLSIDQNIWTITRDGQVPLRITVDGGEYPNWSPTGDRITYFKPSVGGGHLWIMNADGTGETPVPGWCGNNIQF